MVAFNPAILIAEGKFAASKGLLFLGLDSGIAIYDSTNSAVTISGTVPTTEIYATARSADGTLLAALTSNTVYIYSMLTGTPTFVTSLAYGLSQGADLCFSPDGTKLMIADQTTTGQGIFMYNTATWAAITTGIPAPGKGCTSCAWSPDGTIIALALKTFLFKTYNAATGAALATQPATLPATTPTVAVRFSPDGTKCVVIDNGGAHPNINTYNVTNNFQTVNQTASGLTGTVIDVGVAFSSGNILVLGVGTSSPFFEAYSYSGIVPSIQSAPATPPQAEVVSMGFTKDGSKCFVGASVFGTVTLTEYTVSGWVKLTNPAQPQVSGSTARVDTIHCSF